MAARFTALASGSAGNSCLIEADGCGVLLDFGLGPRTLASRMAARGLSWKSVSVALLTHTHGDHWHEITLVHLGKHGIRLCCHASHADHLAERSGGFDGLRSAGLVTTYETGQAFEPATGLTAIPLAVQHDGGETFGFRFEGGRGLFGPSWAVGYAADLGCWDNQLARSLSDVDLLALEFNHDVQLQRTSGRPTHLIRRVLGDRGHLSNHQAKDLLGTVLAESAHVKPQQVVPLHLSRQCNRPDLALTAARDALLTADRPAEVFIAPQDEPGPTLMIGGPVAARRRRPPAA
ncbi:MAG TPA: MBL fold metallo-hydrolase [Gemmataceae bacterium]|nr:MBL fold metallo-hydrolase [Gemmataceae bacterium]